MLAGLCTLALLACAPRPPEQWPGLSNAPASEAEPSAAASAKLVRWRQYAQVEQLALVSPLRVPANNHDPFQWDLRVRITPASLPAYLAWHVGAVMPEDTWIVAEHFAREGQVRGPYYFAHKSAAGWEFGSANSEGALMPATSACQRCHAEAPADFVFAAVPPAGSRPENNQRPDGG